MLLNIANPSPLCKPISFYYNFLKCDQEEDYQQLHKRKSRDFLAWNIVALFFRIFRYVVQRNLWHFLIDIL